MGITVSRKRTAKATTSHCSPRVALAPKYRATFDSVSIKTGKRNFISARN
jgi:hypothetical protein